MPCRRLVTPIAIFCLACLVAVPACKKKQPGGGGEDQPTPGGPPATVSSEGILFAHLRAKDIRESAIFSEVKQAITKAGMAADWDKFEQDAAKEMGGVKPTEIDSVTIYVPEIAQRGMPKFIVIITTSKPIVKTGAFGLRPDAKPDSRGFYALPGDNAQVHFPDDKTVVLLHSDLAQKYLDGYAKDRTGWPMSAELTKAAAGHTLFAIVQLSKLPKELLAAPEAQMGGPLLSAQTITLTADLKGKELSVAARATFPDATAAGKAKETVQGFITLGSNFIDNFMKGKGQTDLDEFMPAVREAQRALKEAKVDVSGSDLTVAGSYKADFDVGTIAVNAVKKVRGAASKMSSSNNLKQMGIALHTYHDASGLFPVHAIGAKGMPLKNATDKPLLSWRVAILPYVEQNNLYQQFKLDEPWDSPNNKKLIEMMPKLYEPVGKPGEKGYTPYQMVIGPKAMAPVGTKIFSITDGTSNTIAVVEAANPVIWTKPDDVMLPGNELPKELKKKFGGQFPNGFNVLFWDGSVRFVPDTITEQRLGQALTPNGGEVSDTDLDGTPYPKFPQFPPKK